MCHKKNCVCVLVIFERETLLYFCHLYLFIYLFIYLFKSQIKHCEHQQSFAGI